MAALVSPSLTLAPRRVQSRQSYSPVPDDLLSALLANDSVAFQGALAQQCLDINSFFVWTDPKTDAVVLRSLVMIAAFHAATDILLLLLASGGDVKLHAPDDQITALHCACSNMSSTTTMVISLLIQAGAELEAVDKHHRTARDLLSMGILQASTSDAEVEDNCYKADDFRMYSFKVELCQRLDEQHDWTTCPFVHPGEKARRRDPRTHKYDGVPCPDFRKGSCKRGDACPYAHGVFECWLHPIRYRTQLCKEGALCKRGVCFFAHSMDELREPLQLHAPSKCDEGSLTPSSPQGPLAESSHDTTTTATSSRSGSPSPRSALSVADTHARVSTHARTCVSPKEGSPSPPSGGVVTTPTLRGGLLAKEAGGLWGPRVSDGSTRCVLSRSHSVTTSTDTSMSNTPIPGGSLNTSFSDSDLVRSLSNLSLSPEDAPSQASAAAAAAAIATLGFNAAQQGLPSIWGQQVPSQAALALSQSLQVGGLPLGGSSFVDPAQPRSPFIDQAALLQALALHQGLATTQAPSDHSTTAAILAMASSAPPYRPPLATLSLNLPNAFGNFNHAPAPYHTCFGI